MKNKKEKGFALVLSLVLLMAMSLMGGALIVISASDHQSNNLSDEYQQTFYVAETALLEGEKYIINQFLGPYKTNGDRDTSKRQLVGNSTNTFATGTPAVAPSAIRACFNSYVDIDRSTFKAVSGPDPDNPTSTTNVDVHESKSYYDFLTSGIVQSGENNREKKRMQKFKYEYFMTRVGSAPFKGYGTSIKKDATDASSDGMAYRVYGCGNFDNGKIIVALESTIVLPK
tara:strand:+ start:1557 stop:2243 length:687 start_codon:yes stop_codon:yes gene_type:complete